MSAEDEYVATAGDPGDPEAAAPVDYLSSPLSSQQVDALRQPLAPNRIRERAGRGEGKFQYIATHDAVRVANEIFGYGSWGHEIVKLERIGEVQVQGRGDKRGWHVAYMCVVRLFVRAPDGEECVPVSGAGYGDATEYGAAAQLTASELAIKESESDALKRALKNWGDQFGLILYAKTDERRRIEREQASDEAMPVHDEDAGRPQPARTWPELNQRLANAVGRPEDAQEWMQQTIELWAPESRGSLRALSNSYRSTAFQKFNSVLLILEETPATLFVTREETRMAIAQVFDGIAVDGPPWYLGPPDDGLGLPSYEDWLAQQSAGDDATAPVEEGATAE